LTQPSASQFDILAPARWTTPMVFNSPHSGQWLPETLLAQTSLSEKQLRTSADTFVDELFAGCLDAGAPLMRSLVSRAYLDLNREPYELDARMFKDRLPPYVNCASPRVASGLGTLPRTVGDGVLIYDAPLDFADAVQRIETLYRPYHRALGNLLEEAHQATGLALLLDCHSMPSSAVNEAAAGRQLRIDIVLGDRFGNACAPELSDWVEDYLQNAGLRVSRNKPYSGGFFTEHHGRPRQNRHALQIEVNRALYMNEKTATQNSNFNPLRNVFNTLAYQLAQWLSDENRAWQNRISVAAE
jgi:N-formylglutamate amidohydrolase